MSKSIHFGTGFPPVFCYAKKFAFWYILSILFTLKIATTPREFYSPGSSSNL